jgi:hypothetical protein
LSFFNKSRKDISTNYKEVRGEGVSLSKTPLRDKILSRFPIHKDGEGDSRYAIHNGGYELVGEVHRGHCSTFKRVPFFNHPQFLSFLSY